MHTKVFSLSSVSLTPSQIHILSKGLKFTSTLQRNLPIMEKKLRVLLENLGSWNFFHRTLNKIHLTPLSLKTNPTSVILKTKTALWNL